jgi:hypothetical protein
MHSKIESSVCSIFFKGNVYSKDVEKESDEGNIYTEKVFAFKPASKAAEIGQQFVDFGLTEILFCPIILSYFLFGKINYSEPEKKYHGKYNY